MRARVVVSAVGAVLAYYGLTAVIAIGIGAVLPGAWYDGRFAVAAATLPVLAAALLVNGAIVARGWSSLRQLGWPAVRPAGAALIVGCGIGIAISAVAVALAVVGGGARLVLTGETFGAYVAAAGVLGLGLAVAALAEELLFRGFPLARLAEPLGRVGASVLLAFAFAAMHLANPEVSALGLVNLVLASLVLSAAFFWRGACTGGGTAGWLWGRTPQ